MLFVASCFLYVAFAQADLYCAAIEIGLAVAAKQQHSPCFDELSHNCTLCTANPDCAFCPHVNIAVTGTIGGVSYAFDCTPSEWCWGSNGAFSFFGDVTTVNVTGVGILNIQTTCANVPNWRQCDASGIAVVLGFAALICCVLSCCVGVTVYCVVRRRRRRQATYSTI